MDWKEITPIPDGAHDIRQIWNANCFNCHGTNIVQGYDVDEKKYTIDVDRDGHRLRGLPRARPPARRVDGGVGEESGIEAEVRQQLEEPAAERHAEDLLDAQLRAAARLRHLRLLPRQQEQRRSSASRAAIALRTTRCRS